MAGNSKYTKEIEECKNAFNIEHRLYNEDSYFIKFFKFPENHSARIRNTDIKEIGKLFDKSISQRVIASLVSRHQGPDIPYNVIRNHVFGNLDVFHRFFYETLLDSDAFAEMVRVATALNYHVNDKDEELLIEQANSLRERFYDYVANNFRMNRNGSKKADKLKANSNMQNPVYSNGMALAGLPLNQNSNNSALIQMPVNQAQIQSMQSMQSMQAIQVMNGLAEPPSRVYLSMGPTGISTVVHMQQPSYADDGAEGSGEGHQEDTKTFDLFN